MSNKKTIKKIGSFSLNDKKTQTVMSSLSMLISGTGVGLIFLTKAYEKNVTPLWVIVLSIIGFIVAHELIHILFMSVFALGKVNVRIKFPTIAVGSDAYFNRTQYIVIALAPVIVLGLAISICLLILQYKFLLAILLVLNFASASGDYILTFYALKQEKNTYFVDTAEKTLIYKQEVW